MMIEQRKTNCQLCGYFCGTIVTCDEKNRILSTLPDPDRYPYDPSVMGACRRFSANREFLDHPDRINFPLRRKGKRGSGRWEKVSWDEALSDITARLFAMKKRYGAESLSTCISAPHTVYWPMHRFLNLWGSPNNAGIGIVCWNPRIWVNSLTYGWPIDDEVRPGLTSCVILWGVNPAESDRSLFWKTLKDFVRGGGRLYVIDPIRTKTARLTRDWLAIKPGTDGALALAMLHVIIYGGHYDRDFVDNYCSGFEHLKQRVALYTPYWAQGITGIHRDVVEEIALAYAGQTPSSIFTGLGIDQTGRSCTGALRAIACLRAVCGNIDLPGASILNDRPDFAAETDLELNERLRPEQKAKKLGGDSGHLYSYEGYRRLTEYTLTHGKKLPARYLTSVHPSLLWTAMITGHPYPVKGLITMASNPLLTQADTNTVYRALKSLDLLVCLEHVMTPTAMLADYVLPVTGSFEQPLFQINGGTANVAYGGKAAIPSMYERRSDFDIWRDLAVRCGQKDDWPWETFEQALDDILSPAGLSWDEFCKSGFYGPEHTYGNFMSKGFSTPSGKVELYSKILDDLGFDPLPVYIPDEHPGKDWDLTLITGIRKHPYYSSEFRQIRRIRDKHPRPLAHMSPATAADMGFSDGDEILIETDKGKITQTLSIVPMRDKVVAIEYGWWFPEMPSREPELGGLWLSNANVLTSAEPVRCDQVLGQWNFRSLPCRVFKKVNRERLVYRNGIETDRDALVRMLEESGMDYAGSPDEYIVAAEGPRILACLRLEESENMMVVRPLAVASICRGQGLGRELLERYLPFFRTAVLVARGHAVPFYQTLGFTPAQSWDDIPENQRDDCLVCLDQRQCRPCPMIRYGQAGKQKAIS